MLETLRDIERVYRSNAADMVSLGNLASLENETIQFCNIVEMNRHSVVTPTGDRLNFPHPFPRQVVAAVALAMEHLNTGNGSIIPDIQNLNETCNIRFIPEFIDTEGEAKAAVKQLIRIVDRDVFRPCAFIGAFRSEVSIPTAIITGVEGFPQVTALSTDPQLDDKEKFPLFGSVISKVNERGRPLLEYLYREWQVRNLAVLHENGDVSLAYLDSLQKAVGDFPQMRLVTVGFPENEIYDASFASKIKLLKDTDMRFFFVITRSEFVARILQEASTQGIAGTGLHNWIFSDEWLPPHEFEPTSPQLSAATGAFVYKAIGSRHGVGAYDKFMSAWASIGEIAEDTSFLQTKLPAHSGATGYSTAIGAEVFGDMYPSVPLFYDATVLLGLSACNSQEISLAGARHFAELVNITFVGASGPLGLDPRTGSRVSSKSIFLLSNFIPKLLPNGNYTLESRDLSLYQIGEWGNEFSLLPLFNDNTSNIPADLPPLDVEENHIGPKLRGFGCGLFAVVLLTAIVMASWTFCHRRSRVIRASQPFFLYFICIGATTMAASLIPMSLDDEILSEPSIACFGHPVLLTIGWCVAMSALLSKTMVVNAIFRKPAFRRVVLKRSDILKPMVLLLLANVSVLVLWSVFSPYKWTRVNVEIDDFQRPKETLGQCESENGYLFWTAFLIINVGVLSFASQQAFVARKIAIEFAESEYISMTMSITMVVAFVSCPVMFMVADDPKAFYFVRSAFVFVVSMTLLVLLFLPKIIYFRQHGNRNYEAAVKFTLDRLHKPDNRYVPNEHYDDDTSTTDNQVGARVVDHPKLRQEKEETLVKLHARNKLLEDRLAEYESVSGSKEGDSAELTASDKQQWKKHTREKVSLNAEVVHIASSELRSGLDDSFEDVRIAAAVGASYLQNALREDHQRSVAKYD